MAQRVWTARKKRRLEAGQEDDHDAVTPEPCASQAVLESQVGFIFQVEQVLTDFYPACIAGKC